MGASGVAFSALGGQLSPIDPLPLARPLAGAIAVYFLINTLLVAGAIAVSTGRSLLATWQDDFLWSGASFMVAGSAGALAAIVIARGEAWEGAFLVAPVYLTYRTYELFVGRLDDERRHGEESRALQQETMRALNQVRDAEHARDEHLAREQAARAAAEEASRIKDQFLAVVSHELRTPLTAILGWSDMLRLGLLADGGKQEAFQTIYESACRQAQLIDDLLDVSRIASGKLRLQREPVSLAGPLQAALQVIAPSAEAKSIRVDVDVDVTVGTVSGDPARLQQVIWNLLSNAVKFTPRGGAISVRLGRAGDAAEIRVTDTGQGIAPEFLPRVFDAFRQEDASTTRVQAGLGLGLSIARNLVEAHGGTIAAESEGRDKGATFVVSLPMSAPAVVPHGVSRGRANGVAVSLSGVTVLVVDDDEPVREVVAAQLRHCQAEVLTASSASEGFDALMQQHVDVLLADIGMPGEDGYSFIRRVRAAETAQAAIPAAALTAFAREEDRKHALDAGFQMHLSKPLDAHVLIAAVADLCRSRAMT
jgi:signal transduction histidine kinase/CheY-like chemotaxis protein